MKRSGHGVRIDHQAHVFFAGQFPEHDRYFAVAMSSNVFKHVFLLGAARLILKPVVGLGKHLGGQI